MAIFAGSCILAGCSSAPSRASRQVSDWKSPEFVEQSAAPPAVPQPAALTASPSVPILPPVATPAYTNQFPETWVPVSRWCKSTGIAEPACMLSAAGAAWVLKTANGTFVFHPGTQMAQYQGVEVRLGFAPQLIDRQPYIHRLDLTKTVLP